MTTPRVIRVQADRPRRDQRARSAPQQENLSSLVPIEFEIDCELPDKYVRKDEFPAQDTDVTVSGFRDENLIVFPKPSAGRGGPPPAQRLSSARQDFARLMLGAFAASYPSFPLTFRYSAEGEAPEGKAETLSF